MNRAYDCGMSALTANDLKTRGIVAIEESLARQPEAFISVRGKDRFVVMGVAQYHHLRECELDAALAESRADEATGKYVMESAQAHMARLDRLLEPPKAAGQSQVAKPRPRGKTAARSGRAGSAR
jgi:hypothetical protein